MIRGQHCGRSLLASLVIVMLLAACARAEDGLDPATSDLVERLEAVAPDLLVPLDGPGWALALIYRGALVWSAGFGMADIERALPIEPDTRFMAASLSKAVVAWGILLLVDRGLIDLDAPVETYLVRWHLPPSAFEHNGVTVRRLLSHTSGLVPYAMCSIQLTPYAPGGTIPGLVEALNSAGPLCIVYREPGSRWAYSNYGYGILQLVIEEVTGKDFAAFMAQEILLPLGMASSSFDPLAVMEDSVASAYASAPRSGSSQAVAKRVSIELSSVTAPGGLCTTVVDYARLVAALAAGPEGEAPGRGVVSPEAVWAMLGAQTDVAFRRGHYDAAFEYCLGHEVLQTESCTIVGLEGVGTSWRSQVRLILEERTGFVALSNSGGAGPAFGELLDIWWDWAEEYLGCRP